MVTREMGQSVLVVKCNLPRRTEPGRVWEACEFV